MERLYHGFTALRQPHSVLNETSQSIKALGRSLENDLWHFLLFENLDPESQKAWEFANDGSEALDFDRLMVFLDDRVRSLEVVEGSHSRLEPELEQQMLLTEKNRSHKNSFSLPQCKVQSCQKRHPIWQCAKYRSMTAAERKNFVTINMMCFTCLPTSHRIH